MNLTYRQKPPVSATQNVTNLAQSIIKNFLIPFNKVLIPNVILLQLYLKIYILRKVKQYKLTKK